MRPLPLAVLILIALVALDAPTVAAQTPVSGSFVTRLGRDTVMLERYTLGQDRLEGTLVQLMPRVRIIEYAATLQPDGQVNGIDVEIRPGLPGSEPTVGWKARLRDGRLTMINRRDVVDTNTFAVRSPSVPFLQLSLGLYQVAVNQARGHAGDSIAFDMYGFGAREPNVTFIVRRAPDSLAIGYFGDDMYIAVRPDGSIGGLNGIRTTQKFLAEPAPSLNIEAVTAQFAERERAGTFGGMASPRDTARATVGGATLWVDYGRPSRRGRSIHGEVVAYDEIWRTGANAATQLSSSTDLQVGDVTIPAGVHSLWTLPTASGATLIVNRETGQWGTQHDPSMDLVHLPLRIESLSEVVEQFTISIVPSGTGQAELRFDWDQTRWVLPVAIASP